MDILKVLAPQALRSVGGWLYNSLEDNKIEKFEWQKLLKTLLVNTMMGLGIWAGINYSSMGIDIDLLGASASAALIDIIYWKLKKKK